MATAEATARAIDGLDAGGWFSEAFAGERVPRLDDVLALAAVDFELEFKDCPPMMLRCPLRCAGPPTPDPIGGERRPRKPRILEHLRERGRAVLGGRA